MPSIDNNQDPLINNGIVSLVPTDLKSSYFMATGKVDEKRLKRVNEIYNPKSFDFMLRAGLTAGMNTLEIGCGYGHTAIWMAHIVGQNGANGQVIAVDFSQDTLDIAAENAQKAGVTNIRFICLDVAKIRELKSDSTLPPINFIYGRWIIEFCKVSPDNIISQLFQLLEPNGTFVYETSSFTNSGIHACTENETVDTWRNLCIANARRSGNELNMSGRLTTDMTNCGYVQIYTERHHPELKTPREKSVLTLALDTVAEGVIESKTMGFTSETMAEFRRKCVAFEMNDAQTALFFDVTLASGKKTNCSQ